jgi:hypothetical protein
MRTVRRAGFTLFALLSACTRPGAEDRSFTVPPREDFDAVSEVLHARCGSLDCHGQRERNLRIYGKNGLRLSPDDRPGVDGGVTEEAEHDANYASVVGLEPELTALVHAERGERPERLTLIRKARLAEHHEGGAAAPRGGDADRCVISWLTGALDAVACAAASTYSRPSE